jgi:hypothetical protein
MIVELPFVGHPGPSGVENPCVHRSVSDDGRVLCAKIVDRNNAVCPQVCGDCPFSAINCSHLRFTLTLSSRAPLRVRWNGRTEVWDDEAPKVSLHRAACAARVSQVDHPSACAGCSLRQPIPSGENRLPTKPPSSRPSNIIPFPHREAIAASA